ncbi:MAG: ligand-binding sensor domain-containing protein [Chitinophagaceae bacterium]
MFFQKISDENGLSNNKVNCILQDKRGFIWIGTEDGLNRYDGRYFTVFKRDPGNNSGVSGNIITGLLEDKHGVIWITSSDGGLTRYDYRLPPAAQFKQYRHVPNDSTTIPTNYINAIVQDKKGFLWLASGTKRVLRFHPETERFEIPVNKGTAYAVAMSIDHNDTLWVGRRGGGILKINTNTLGYSMDPRYANLYAGLPHVTVTAVYHDKQRHTWFGSWDNVLYKTDGRTGIETAFPKKQTPNSFPGDDILAFSEDARGQLWMGGKQTGLTIYDPIANSFFNYRHDPAREGTLAHNQVNCIYTDRNGMVWLGTNNGISTCDPRQQSFIQHFLPGVPREGKVYAFLNDGNNTLWVGTSNGLYRSKGTPTQFEHIPLSYNGKKLTVSALFKDVDGRLYLGTDFSFFRFHPETRSVSLLPNTEMDPVVHNIIESRIVSVLRDTINGHPALVVSPYGHYLAYYDLVTERWYSRKDSAVQLLRRWDLGNNLIRKIFRCSEGTILMATAGAGLGFRMNSSQPFTYYSDNDGSGLNSNHIYDLVETGNGSLWVSTYGGGLHFYDKPGNRFTHVPGPANLLEGLQTDASGNIWMIANGNMLRYDPKEQRFTSFLLPDLEKSGGVTGHIYKDAEGILYLPGSNFFIRFQPREVQSVAMEPVVRFTDFRIFNQSFSHLLQNSNIPIRYNQNYFTIEFSAPEFRCRGVEYEYKMEGFDKDWIAIGNRNFANYSNLEGGQYTFKVRASATKGAWSPHVGVLQIEVIPPFWKQWWFLLALVAVTGTGIYALYRYRINEILKRQSIRNKIAQDLHDHVGSTLSSISVYTQVARIYGEQGREEALQDALEKISAASGEMISEMNDIVWAINPRNDNMFTMLQRMESYARPLLQAKNIVVSLEADPGLAQLNLEMEQRKNFYLIFKEAVNNALKYANPATISVEVLVKNGWVTLQVTDDGAGFDPEKVAATNSRSLSGNGLRNMRRRAVDMKGKLDIISAQGKGTTVRLRFPVT